MPLTLSIGSAFQETCNDDVLVRLTTFKLLGEEFGPRRLYKRVCYNMYSEGLFSLLCSRSECRSQKGLI